jgi:hypothetical protein
MANLANQPSISIQINANESSIPMGKTVQIEAAVETSGDLSARDFLLLPFVNGRRWGAHERPDARGQARWSLPLPNPGPAQRTSRCWRCSLIRRIGWG